MVEDGRQRQQPEHRDRLSTTLVTRSEDERPLGELFGDLADEMKTLIQQEVALARVEMKEAGRQATRGASFTAIGGAVAYAGLLVVLVAAGLLLATLMPAWLGFLIVGALVLITGYAVLQTGLNRLRDTDYSFPRTAESLQEDKLWLEKEVQDMKRAPAPPPRRSGR